MNDKNQEIQEIQDKILQCALEDVPFEGWQWSVIEGAAEKAGFERAMAQAVFPDKLSGALRYFSAWADHKMLEALEGTSIADMRVRDRIKLAVQTRLNLLEPYKESVRAASTYWLSPFRKIEAGKVIWQSADRIWRWAGDEATDYNHYTKRALLSGVMTTTMVTWLNDSSSNHKETLAFLDRRIDNVLKFGQATSKIIGQFTGKFNKKQNK